MCIYIYICICIYIPVDIMIHTHSKPGCGRSVVAANGRHLTTGGGIGAGTHQDTIQSPNRLYKASADCTKPRQTIESPDRL